VEIWSVALAGHGKDSDLHKDGCGGEGTEYRHMEEATHIVAFRAIIFTSTPFDDVQFTGLGMTAFVFQTDHALACLSKESISIASTLHARMFE